MITHKPLLVLTGENYPEICAFILVLTGKKPNSAAISDDISDVSSKLTIHYRPKIIGIYPPTIASTGLALSGSNLTERS